MREDEQDRNRYNNVMIIMWTEDSLRGGEKVIYVKHEGPTPNQGDLRFELSRTNFHVRFCS